MDWSGPSCAAKPGWSGCGPATEGLRALCYRPPACFEQKQTRPRSTGVAGDTDLQPPPIALLRRNANLIKGMRVQLKPNQSSSTKHKVWERFQGYTKLIVPGGGAPKGNDPQPKA
ncbi:hypothetical protein ACFST9_07740 [Hymenobacter monticola]|uniref:Uncharacterized protein n=1 Tax=Hymenobacter monticola TaxID=1705399 RepID=A0ABY4B424_9BACT|nr:hypothetical protein [Hymenobacter monticola]UOE33750.1 hypothetical protein MTP16_21840 [Hymenobacter monticola]